MKNRIRECRLALGMTQAELGNTQNGGRLMLHEYRLKKPIHAEQFDGSDEMAKKYGLKKFGWEGFVRTRNSLDNFDFGAPLVFSKGDWFIEGDNGKIDVLSDKDFRRTYERCD